MRYVSTFAGVGGFDLALDAAGWSCAGQVEIDKHATRVLEHHWPHVPRHTDIRTATDWADRHGLAGTVDLVAGGFPCQDLSVAGKRAGLDGARSGLFFDLIRFVQHVHADIVLLENVPGLLTSHQGRDFGVVLHTLADAGFLDIEWSVLDAQHFGVPQRRRRVFIVARRGGAASGRPVFVESAGCRRHPHAGHEAGADAAPGAGGSTDSSGVYGHHKHGGYDHGAMTLTATTNKRPGNIVVAAALTSTGVGTCGADDNQAQARHLVPFVKAKRAQTDTDDETWEPDRPSPTLGAFDSGESRATTIIATTSLGISRYDTERGDAEEARSGEVLRELWEADGEEAAAEWLAGIAIALRPAEILRPAVHGGGVRQEGVGVDGLDDDSLPRQEAGTAGSVRGMRVTESERRSSPRRRPHEQRADELGAIVSVLPPESAQSKAILRGLWKAAEGSRLLREALPAVEEVGGPDGRQGQAGELGVRRLTPRETERLQGFPDDHTAICSDSQRYKQMGNAVAVPVARWIAERINEAVAA